jgi:hypothetical protein
MKDAEDKADGPLWTTFNGWVTAGWLLRAVMPFGVHQWSTRPAACPPRAIAFIAQIPRRRPWAL